jgi:hypothetical protein
VPGDTHHPALRVERGNGKRERGRSTTLAAVRVLVVFGLLALFACIGFVASSSCVLATRDLPDGGDAGTATPPPSTTDAADANFDCGCCERAVLPFLPTCSGRMAFAIPEGDCPKACTDSVAYVLCEGTCYSACECALPDGYSLVDGGFSVGDGGPDDAPEEAARKAGDAGKAHDLG